MLSQRRKRIWQLSNSENYISGSVHLTIVIIVHDSRHNRRGQLIGFVRPISVVVISYCSSSWNFTQRDLHHSGTEDTATV